MNTQLAFWRCDLFFPFKKCHPDSSTSVTRSLKLVTALEIIGNVLLDSLEHHDAPGLAWDFQHSRDPPRHSRNSPGSYPNSRHGFSRRGIFRKSRIIGCSRVCLFGTERLLGDLPTRQFFRASSESQDGKTSPSEAPETQRTAIVLA